MSKKTKLWDKTGFWLRRVHRHYWPDQSVSCEEHNQLKAEVRWLRTDYANLKERLRTEAAIGLNQQAQFLHDLSVMNHTIKTQARELASEMVGPLERRVGELMMECDQLRQLAEYDPLTGLCNRRGLESRFRIAYSALAHTIKPDGEKRHRPIISALMIDIDHFKQINDRYGHPVGDQVLVRVAKILGEHFHDKRPSDILGRFGGEEFLVVLPQSDAGFAYKEASALGFALRSATILDGHPVTVSIGVAEVELGNPTEETAECVLSRLCERSDKALYRAKRPDPVDRGSHPGRDRVMRFDPTMD